MASSELEAIETLIWLIFFFEVGAAAKHRVAAAAYDATVEVENVILDDLHHKQRSTAQGQDEVVDVDLVKKEAVMIVVKKLVGTLYSSFLAQQ